MAFPAIAQYVAFGAIVALMARPLGRYLLVVFESKKAVLGD